MDFLQISVNDIDGEAAEAIAEVFNRYGYGGAVMEMTPPALERVTVRTIIPAEDTKIRRKIEMTLALIDQALPWTLPNPTFKTVGANDWAESWKEHFHVVRIGPRIVVRPSWRNYTPGADDVVIDLDPGLAFGSGLHPTTKLCLTLLQTMPLTTLDIFDVGTGSGILSIAAAKMGAKRVRAVDVDDVAVRVAEENFQRNGLSGVETAVGSAKDNGSRQWSLVIANILSNVLIELMPALKAALRLDGLLMLSGIINDQEQPMLDCLAAHHLTIRSRHVEGDWIALLVSR